MAKTDWGMSDQVMPSDMNAIGTEINELRNDVDNIEIPDGSRTQKGIVQSSNSTTGTSQTLVATEKAVNDARVAAISAASTDATNKSNAVQSYARRSRIWGGL